MTDLSGLSTYREIDYRVSRAKLAPFIVLVITVKGAVNNEFVSVVRHIDCRLFDYVTVGYVIK